MPHFGWTRLAYLLFVLAILTALVELASQNTDSRPLASEPPDAVAAENEPHEPATEPREPVGAAPGVVAALPGSVEDRLEDVAVDVPRAAPALSALDARPPIFHRPASPSPPAGSGDAPVRAPGFGSGPVCGDLEDFPSSRRIVFPLPKAYSYSYEDTWGAPRPQGGHEGTDLMAPSGTREYAVTDGTVVPVAGATENGWNSLGGYAVMLEAADSVGPIRQGDLFYYAHLDRESALEIGTRVRAGQVVGYAGDTGQGPEVTRGLFPPHLHLGWYDATGSRSDVASGAMNPYPLLEWIKANGGAVVGGSDTRYCAAPQARAPLPSTGEGRWPAPPSPGVRPDLDTGSNDPKPSPVVDKRKPPKHRAEPATAAKRPQPPPVAAPETNPPAPKPPCPQAQEPPVPRAGTPQKGPASDAAEVEKHECADERRGTGGQDREERPDKKDPQKDPRKDPEPPDERTSPEEDPTESEAGEPEETTEAEATETESTVPEPAPETTETTTE